MEEKNQKKEKAELKIKLTEEEKEKLFEEALEEIKNENGMRIRVLAKGFLLTMRVLKAIVSFFCTLFGIFFVVSVSWVYIHSIPVDFETTVKSCLYVIGGILMIIVGTSADSLYYIF